MRRKHYFQNMLSSKLKKFSMSAAEKNDQRNQSIFADLLWSEWASLWESGSDDAASMDIIC